MKTGDIVECNTHAYTQIVAYKPGDGHLMWIGETSRAQEIITRMESDGYRIENVN